MGHLNVIAQLSFQAVIQNTKTLLIHANKIKSGSTALNSDVRLS